MLMEIMFLIRHLRFDLEAEVRLFVMFLILLIINITASVDDEPPI